MSKFFLWAVVWMYCAGLGVGIAQAQVVQNIRGAAHSDKTRLVLELDRVGDFRVSLADSPQRLIVEIPKASLNDQAVISLGDLGVTELRQNSGEFQFYLKRPIRLISAFMLPKDGDRPHRLVIDYRSIDPADYPQAMTRVLGTLSARGKSDGILGVLSRTAPKTTSNQTKDQNADPAPPQKKAKYTIVIDAGHGGKDPGAIGVGGVREKDITLAAAQELERQLEKSGRYRIIQTRNTDTFILLPNRVKIAHDIGADLFISLHADMAVDAKDTAGLSIYTLSNKASDAQTEKLAAQENKVDLLAGVDLSGQGAEVTSILIDLAMRENMNQSRFFANKVVRVMDKNNIDLLPRPHRYAGFAVLKAPDVPSVLVEMGFLSNKIEARRLQDETHRRRLMQALRMGIDEYFNFLEKNARS